jgi:nitrogen fixation NifU-like protein
MYRELILDHYQNPRNWGALDDPDIDHAEDNPLCGDHLHLTVKLDENERVTAVGWEGEGCAISQASASLLGEEIIGKTLDELKQFGKDDVLDLLGISISPVRLKCALLSLKVLKAGAYGIDVWPGEDEG